jgi:hypothetical protein
MTEEERILGLSDNEAQSELLRVYHLGMEAERTTKGE